MSTTAFSGVDARVAENVRRVRERIAAACERAGRDPSEVTLIAVTKGRTVTEVAAAVRAGIRDIGENRVQEGETKRELLETAGVSGITWHLVGHLQRNKAGRALRAFDVFHGVDSVGVLEALAKRATRPVPIFLEVKLAAEPSKHGCSLDDVPELIRAVRELPNLDLVGLMTVAPATSDAETVRPVFRKLRALAQEFGLEKLSMGMSNDFEVAVEEGATHLRIGRAIFEGVKR